MTSTYLQNLQENLKSLFEDDDRLILLGEDVLDPYGGAFKVTAGLSTRYPDRVLTTPISEAAIIGVATGLALRGFIPIVEIMFGDFLTLCADQIVNHASKFTQMYPDVRCPVIVRTPMGAGRGYGPTHSQTLEKMFLGIPGLKIIAPSHYHKPGRTLRLIVEQENGPVIFIEHKLLYGEILQGNTTDFPVNIVRDESGYETAVIKNYTKGAADVCVIGYGGVSRQIAGLLTELAKEEIRILAILPECIDPMPVDTISKYASESDRIIIVDEGHEGHSWAAGLSSLMYEKLWGKMRYPIKVLTSNRCIIPTSFDQEAEVILNKQKIEKAILEVLSWE